MTPLSKTQAFTLIELLVVMALIGILAALILSGVSLARTRGQIVVCSNNLRQWGLALYSYMDDYNDFIPRRGQGVQQLALISREEDWFNCLPTYFGWTAFSNLVAQSNPPHAGDRGTIFIDPSAKDPGGTYFLPYAMNMYLSPWIRPQQHQLEDIADPSQLVFMADAPGQYASTVPSQLGYSVAARHGDRANIVFLDGHWQSFTGEYLGCGVGELPEPDIRWQTLSAGINQAPVP